MKIRAVRTWRCFWSGDGRYGIAVEFTSWPPQEFFISHKQYSKLSKTLYENEYSREGRKAYVVLDGDRFVWSGVVTSAYSELEFLAMHFGIDLSSIDELDPHFDNLENPISILYDDLKN